MWEMAQDAEGCRVLQEAFDFATVTDEQRAALAEELKGHVWEAIESKHANHVIQKYIVVSRPEASQFIIDEIMSAEHGAWRTARHVFGIRIFQRLLEHCHQRQTRGMVEEVLQDALGLCKHKYGNFGVQHICEHGSREQQSQVCEVVFQGFTDLCKHQYGNHVVRLCLARGARSPQQPQVARQILQDARGLCKHPHGNLVVRCLLEQGTPQQRHQLADDILQDSESLLHDTYGNFVIQRVLDGGGCPEQQHQLAMIIREHVQLLCADERAVAVVGKALSCGACKDRVAVARAVLKLEGIAVSMARSRHGHETLKYLLEVPAEKERQMASSMLCDNVRELKRSRYGRDIAEHLSL